LPQRIGNATHLNTMPGCESSFANLGRLTGNGQIQSTQGQTKHTSFIGHAGNAKASRIAVQLQRSVPTAGPAYPHRMVAQYIGHTGGGTRKAPWFDFAGGTIKVATACACDEVVMGQCNVAAP
jgi:hypothetical protein